MSKPAVSGTAHTLPFDQLSPRDFERLCLWLVEREGYEEAEHLGAAGSEQGRDLLAWREGRLWAFQCKRVRSFGPADAIGEIDKLAKLSEDKRPVGLIFLVTCDVSALARERAQDRCIEVGMACRFWASTELDQKVKRHPEIVREFFQAGIAQAPGALTAIPRAGVGGGQVDEARRLVLWGKLPFPLVNRVAADQRWRRLDGLPTTFDPAGTEAEWLPSLPPLPVLSLDPGDRVERAFKAAGKRLRVVLTQRDVPARDRHNLIKLAGDLGRRSGVVLSRAEIPELRSDAEKRHLLKETRRAVEGGTLLLVGCDPASDDFRAWWAALVPVFEGADLYAVGERAAAWPEGVECLGSDLEAARAALEGAGVESGLAARPNTATKSEPAVRYQISTVRDLLLAGFTADDLRRLVLYTSKLALEPLIHEFGSGDGLSAMVEKTVTFCQKQDCMGELLEEVKEANPRRYAQFEGDLLAKG